MRVRAHAGSGRRRAAVAAVAAMALGSLLLRPTVAGAGAHHVDRVAQPTSAAALPDELQATAERPIPLPPTPSCVDTLSVHDFAFSYGAPDKGAYVPPAACTGPWSLVVLTLTSTVGGVQFDRSLTVSIGDVVLLHGTTSEPCCTTMNTVTWSVQRDVTQYSSLLAGAHTYAVQLDNVVDGTYTGVYHTTVTLTFYEPGPSVRAATVPDLVVPVTTGDPNNEEYTIDANGRTVGRSVTLPPNLVTLHAELFANGQGPCEEFWWSAPNGTSCLTGTPYREVAIYIDGVLAGAAPVYPTVFTGGDGPGLWEPIPSPRTWNLRPYVLDLGPFVGVLDDGLPHAVTLGVLDSAIGHGDFWPVAANLLATVDPVATPGTGALTAHTGAATPTDDTSGSTPATYSDAASHRLTFSGWVTTAGGTITDTVTENSSATDTQDAAAGVSTDTSWTWSTESNTVQTFTGHLIPPPLSTDTVTAGTSSILSTALTHFSFTDNARTTTTMSEGGAPSSSWSEFDESMDTTDTSGLAFNGVQHEVYRYGDSTGVCYDRTVTGTAGQATSVDGQDCPGAQLPVAVPDGAPVALLTVAAITMLLATLVAPVRRRPAGPLARRH